MTIDELKEKIGFIADENVVKNTTVYVSSPSGLQLFNLAQDDVDELSPIYVDILNRLVVCRDDLSLSDYSTTASRENIIYRYDLAADTRTTEMCNMATAGLVDNPQHFTVSNDSLESITGFYVVMKSVDKRCVFYKEILPIDKTYGRASLFFGCKHDNSMFERKRDSLLRITPGIQMFYVDDEIILIDMKKLEKSLNLDAILQKEAQATYDSVVAKELAVDINLVKDVCQKPSMLKKLRHALTCSKVKELSNEQVISFAQNQPKLNFRFNEDNTKFDIVSKAAAIRFIKLLDDDYLFSKLTNADYDSDQKDELKQAED